MALRLQQSLKTIPSNDTQQPDWINNIRALFRRVLKALFGVVMQALFPALRLEGAFFDC
jgi:hypothetical protein